MKVIYILSLGHSGSTILDLTLSRFRDVVGLGELRRILHKPRILQTHEDDKSKEAVCACGRNVSSCSFWSTMPRPTRDLTLEKKYREFFETLGGKGAYEAAVDSSKSLPVLEILSRLDKEGVIELYPVFLIRDVRGWILSGRQTDERAQRRIRSYPYYTLAWYRWNRAIKHVLDAQGKKYLQVSYEQFCFDTEATVARIRDYAGLPERAQSDDGATASHNLNGNRTRRSPRQEVVYDRRWFREFGTTLWPLLLPRVFVWNIRNVYKD